MTVRQMLTPLKLRKEVKESGASPEYPIAVKKQNYRRIFAVINSYIYRTIILGNGKIHLRVQ